MKLASLLALAALCLPFSALAEMQYNYGEIGYRYTELADEEGDGFDLKANFLLGDLFYFSADLDEVEFDSDLQYDRFGLGIGLHFNVATALDLFAVASYEDLEIDVPSTVNFDDKGYGVQAGARYALDDKWEFSGAVDYVDYEGDAEIENIRFVGEVVYNLSNNYAVVGKYAGGELNFDAADVSLEENNLRIGLRAYF